MKLHIIYFTSCIKPLTKSEDIFVNLSFFWKCGKFCESGDILLEGSSVSSVSISNNISLIAIGYLWEKNDTALWMWLGHKSNLTNCAESRSSCLVLPHRLCTERKLRMMIGIQHICRIWPFKYWLSHIDGAAGGLIHKQFSQIRYHFKPSAFWQQ